MPVYLLLQPKRSTRKQQATTVSASYDATHELLRCVVIIAG